MGFLSTPQSKIYFIEDEGNWIQGNTYEVRANGYRRIDQLSNPIQNVWFGIAPVSEGTWAGPGPAAVTPIDYAFPVSRTFPVIGGTSSYKVQPSQPRGFNGLSGVGVNGIYTEYTASVSGDDTSPEGSVTSTGFVSQGDYVENIWDRHFQFTIPENAKTGGFQLLFVGYTYSTVTGVFPDQTLEVVEIYRKEYNITINPLGGQFKPFPNQRPAGYAQDDYWDPDAAGTGDWTSDSTDLTTLGGGRYGKQIMILGHKAIYFGGLT